MAKRKRLTKDQKDEDVIVSKDLRFDDEDDFSECVQAPRKRKALATTTTQQASEPHKVAKKGTGILDLPTEILDDIILEVIGDGAVVAMTMRRRQLTRDTHAKETYSTKRSPDSFTTILCVSRAFFEAGVRAFYGNNILLFNTNGPLHEFINHNEEYRLKFVKNICLSFDWNTYRRLITPLTGTEASVKAMITNKFEVDFEKMSKAFSQINKVQVSLRKVVAYGHDADDYERPDFPHKGQFQWQSKTDPTKSLTVHWDHERRGKIMASKD